MAQIVPLPLTTFQEYLDLEDETSDKHELFRGRVYAMAGGSRDHSPVIVSLTQACGRALRGRKPCLFVVESERVRVEVLSRLEDDGWVQRVYLPGTVVRLPSASSCP